MNYEIKKENWANFFESLSKRRYEWKTRIEVLNLDMGYQTLTKGLPLNGVTVETKGDRTSIDISVGESTDAHQTHNVQNPSRVAFLPGTENHGDVIDIEEEDGTKTLITFIEPMGLLIGYMEIDIAAAA
ncbi:hypothetical protein BH24ACI3_BH24ACI3_08020 [soil metagenome]